MVKNDNGKMEFVGNRSPVCAELTQLMHTARTDILTYEEYKACIELASMSEEQLKERREQQKKTVEELSKLLKDLSDGIKTEMNKADNSGEEDADDSEHESKTPEEIKNFFDTLFTEDDNKKGGYTS